MTFSSQPSFSPFTAQDEQEFAFVIQKLKERSVLPASCFQDEHPFFNLPTLSKEFKIRELFESACNPQLCKQLLRNVVQLGYYEEYKLVPQNFSPISCMSFAQIVLYKVLPCPYENCRGCPREIATHNQYRDYEYQCPFYHHERDRRRPSIAIGTENDFIYKANYYEEGKRQGNRQKYSKNYFESMFHPLYYKMFSCKRNFCEKSAFCPFNHSEEEKALWEANFCSFIGRDRTTYIKDKQTKHKKTVMANANAKAKETSEATLFAIRQLNDYFDGNLKPIGFNKQAMFENIPNVANEHNLNEQFVNVFANERSSPDSSFEEQYGYGFMNKLRAANYHKIY